MNRGAFIRSAIGLVGVASSLKELRSLKEDLCVVVPMGARVGDILVDKNGVQYWFSGTSIRKIISTRDSKPIKAIRGVDSNFFHFCSVFEEK